jgi:hypothetical protein
LRANASHPVGATAIESPGSFTPVTRTQLDRISLTVHHHRARCCYIKSAMTLEDEEWKK